VSKLLNWIKQNMYEQHDAAVPLTELYQAFSSTLTTYERRQWQRGAVVQALTDCGYRMEDRGRRDQPKRVVLGLTFDAPRVHRQLVNQIKSYISEHVVYRFAVSSEEIDESVWAITIAERPDYSLAQYSISYEALSERLIANGIQATAQVVRAALRNWAKWMSALYTSEAGWDCEEVVAAHNQYVHCLGPDGLIGYRWKADNDHGEDYFGQYVPASGQTSRVMRISLDRAGERVFAPCT
jgi:hypothetical protein